MKRKTMLFFLIAALLAFAVHAADTVNVRLDDLGLSLDVPSDCSIFTRDMSPDDPALEEKGIDFTELQELLTDGNIYLNLLNDDPAFESLVTMQANAVESMSIFDDDMLEALKEPLAQEYESAGMKVSSVDYFTTDQTVLFRTEGSINTTQVLVYYTVHNHQAISMVLRYEGDAIPEEYRTAMQAMVDSVRFDEAAATPDGDASEAEAAADVEAAAEEAVDEIEAAEEALEEEAAATESLISPAEEATAQDEPAQDETESPAPAKKKGLPILPLILGGAAIGAGVGFFSARSRKKRAQQPTYAVPMTPAAPTAPVAPAATVPPASAAAAAAAGAAAPIAQAVHPAAAPAAAASAVPAAPAAPAVPTGPAKRVCAACGADLGPDDSFCPYCGTKV